jgi:AcrR family transcriptional regulator
MIDDPVLVEKRRAQIVTAATTLFASQGFYRTTIKEIAKKAGVSPGLVYQYVREKEDVLLLVLLGVVDAYAREIPLATAGINDPLERLTATISAYCHVIERHRAATILAYRSTKSLAPEKRAIIQRREIETNQLISSAISACIKAGYVRKVDLDVATYQIVMAAHGWALKSWYFKTRMSVDEYVDANIDLIFSGLLTTSGQARYRGARSGRAAPLVNATGMKERNQHRRRRSATALR